MIKFRLVQALTTGTITGYWLLRLATHPNHMHLSMLVMAAVAVGLSELGYRAGKKETEDSLVRTR
jgi:hypothetical protein